METTPAIQSSETAVNIVEFQNIVAEAPAILDKNKNSLAKAKQVGEELFATIERDGMSDLYDQSLATYIDKLSKTSKAMNDGRKPFTQLVDKFKKMFTEAESEIKSFSDKAQALRNQYATKKMNEQRERERLAQLKLDQDKETIDFEKRTTIALSEAVSKGLTAAKQKLNAIFEAATLDTLEAVRKQIVDYPISFSREYYDSIQVSLVPLYIDKADVVEIVIRKKEDTFVDENARYQSGMVAYKRELIEKIPSKKVELEELAKASAEEAERIAAEQAKRKQEEEDKLKREEEEAKRKAENEANVTAAAATTNSIVASQATLGFDEAPKVKEGYEITVSNPAGYLVLTQFWFEKEGKKWAIDKFEKMTFARIKKFCEDWAIKNDERVESPFITYTEIFKAK